MNAPELPGAGEKRAFVRDMFDRIAPRYDTVNRVISLGRDHAWRRAAVDAIELSAGDEVIDLATGTGDFARLARARGARVIGVDFSRGMLRAGRQRDDELRVAQADAARLPFRDESATVVLCGFSLRNFTALPDVFSECARVLRPNGRLAIVEVDEPRSTLLRRGYDFHFRRIVPRLGAWLSDAPAYRYLPASTVYLPPEAELLDALRTAGFEDVEKRSHMFGAVQQLTARRR